MKRVIIAAMALLAMASCSEDSDLISAGVVGSEVSFRSSAIESRVAIKSNWDNNDQIGIYMEDSDNAVLSDNVLYNTSASGVFTSADGADPIYYPRTGEAEFYAYHPYSSSTADGKVALSVVDQTLATIDVLVSNKITASKSDMKDVDFTFSHALSMIEVVVEPSKQYPDLLSADVPDLYIECNREAKYDLASGDIVSPTNSDKITLSYSSFTANEVTYGNAVGALIPADYTNVKLCFEAADGKVYSHTLDKEFVSGKRYLYRAKLGSDKLLLTYKNSIGWQTNTSVNTTSQVYRGEGTAEEPYLITGLDDLIIIASDLDAFYKLEKDIVIPNGTAWTPIGSAENKFTGSFDGGGHTISGLKIDDDGKNYQGLFGYAEGATIKNVGVEGEINAGVLVGGIVGYMKGSLISHCYSNVSITGKSFIGGIVGQFAGGSVEYCYNVGSVVGSSSGNGSCGGIIGYGYSKDIYGCYNAGKVAGPSSSGPIVGYERGSTTNNDVYYIFISGSNVTSREPGTKKRTAAEMNAVVDDMNDAYGDEDKKGGFKPGDAETSGLPYLFDERFTYITPPGQSEDDPILITGAEGLEKIADDLDAFYKLDSDIVIPDGTEWTPIGSSTNKFTGSFDGGGHKISGLKIENSDSDVDNHGLFGYAEDATIKNVGVEGAINVSGDNVGGVVGCISGSESRISHCYSNVIITGGNNLGGIVGDLVGGTVEYCYNVGAVGVSTSSQNCGGIAGHGSSSDIYGCYNAGRVRGLADSSQPIVGGNVGSSTNNDLYYVLIAFSNVADSIIGTEKSDAAEMNAVVGDLNGAIEDRNGSFKASEETNGLPYLFDEQFYLMDKGAGTQDNPYKIYTESDLMAVAYGLDAYYELMNNIELTSSNWRPIGSSKPQMFTGSFDGGGHEISGLKIENDNSSVYYHGLFGYARNATIKNLGVEGEINVRGSYVGGIVGYLEYASSHIRNCYSNVSISGYEYLGGIVGGFSDGVIENCYNVGAVIGNSSSNNYVGGIIGAAWSRNFFGCYNAGKVYGSLDHSGPICFSEQGYIPDSNNAYILIDGSKVGIPSYTHVTSCETAAELNARVSYMNNAVEGDNGIFKQGDAATNGLPYLFDERFTYTPPPGLIEDIPIIISDYDGLYKIRDNLDAFYKLSCDIVIPEGTNWIPIGSSTNKFTGSLNGDGHKISGLKIVYDGPNEYDYCGLFGYAENATFKNLGVEGEISVTGDKVGGIVGCIIGNGSLISHCYSNVSISGGDYLGGIAGKLGDASGFATVEYCYNVGSVGTSTGSSHCGGIAGSGHREKTFGCYNAGKVIGDYYFGPIFGITTGSTVCDANYYIIIEGSVGFSSTFGTEKANAAELNAVVGDLNGAVTGKPGGFKASTVERGLPYLFDEQFCLIDKGDGSSANPYKIFTESDLVAVAKDLDASYILMNDIKLTSDNWAPIGNDSNKFEGTFDGGGYLISNLKIERVGDDQGLFGYIDGATIKNVGVEGEISITGESAGGIVGSVSGDSSRIRCCYSNVSISGTSGSFYLGGIVGELLAGNVLNCYNVGDVGDTSESNNCGGIVGLGGGDCIFGCYNAGKIYGKRTSSGPISGSNLITNSTNDNYYIIIPGSQIYDTTTGIKKDSVAELNSMVNDMNDKNPYSDDNGFTVSTVPNGLPYLFNERFTYLNN